MQLLMEMPTTSVVMANQLLAVLKDSNKGDVASQILHSFPYMRIEPDLVSYNTVTSALERSSLWQHGLEQMKELVERGYDRPDLKANVISLNTLLACIRRSSNWRAALLAFGTHQTGANNCCDLLISIQQTRVQPDGISYATAVNACADALKWTGALALLSQLTKMQRKCKASQLAALTTVLTACGSISKWLQGLQVLEAACDACDLDSAVLGAMVNACATGQAWELAVATWQQAERQGQSNLVVHRSAIAACELGSWQMALFLLQLYNHRYLTTVRYGHRHGHAMAFVACMAAAAKATQWSLVLSLLQESHRFLGEVSYTNLAGPWWFLDLTQEMLRI